MKEENIIKIKRTIKKDSLKVKKMNKEKENIKEAEFTEKKEYKDREVRSSGGCSSIETDWD